MEDNQKQIIQELFLSNRIEAIEQEEISFKQKDGAAIDSMINAGPNYDSESHPNGYTLFLTDLTETKLLRDHLYAIDKRNAVGRLAGGIAHEFNNIHGAIQGYSELLLRDPELKDQNIEDLQAIRQLIRRASHITQQLLVFSRKDPPQKEPANLETLIEGNVNIVKKEYETEGITIMFKLNDPLPLMNLDAGRIGQVIMTLIINARDSVLEGGKDKLIRVIGGRKKEMVYIEVSDTGVGVPQDVGKKVFEPFYTTKGPIKGSTVPGTGLGA